MLVFVAQGVFRLFWEPGAESLQSPTVKGMTLGSTRQITIRELCFSPKANVTRKNAINVGCGVTTSVWMDEAMNAGGAPPSIQPKQQDTGEFSDHTYVA